MKHCWCLFKVLEEEIQFSRHQNSISPLMIPVMPGLVSRAVTSIVQTQATHVYTFRFKLYK